MENAKNSKPPLLVRATNLFFFLCGIILIGIGIWKVVIDNAAISTVTLTAGLLMLLAASIDRFEVLKGFGIEAKTRKLDEKISEAEVIIEKLKILTEISGSTMISLEAKSGRMSGVAPSRESYRLVTSIRSILESFNTPQHRINEILSPWQKICIFDLQNSFYRKYDKHFQEYLQSLNTELNKINFTEEREKYDRLRTQINEVHERQRHFSENMYDIKNHLGNLKRLFKENAALTEAQQSEVLLEIDSWNSESQILLNEFRFGDEERWHKQIDSYRA